MLLLLAVAPCFPHVLFFGPTQSNRAEHVQIWFGLYTVASFSARSDSEGDFFRSRSLLGGVVREELFNSTDVLARLCRLHVGGFIPHLRKERWLAGALGPRRDPIRFPMRVDVCVRNNFLFLHTPSSEQLPSFYTVLLKNRA